MAGPPGPETQAQRAKEPMIKEPLLKEPLLKEPLLKNLFGSLKIDH
jgi:hypothetical protein